MFLDQSRFFRGFTSDMVTSDVSQCHIQNIQHGRLLASQNSLVFYHKRGKNCRDDDGFIQTACVTGTANELQYIKLQEATENAVV